jgi:hypothetical protein
MTTNETPKNILLIGGSLIAIYALFKAAPSLIKRQIEKSEEKKEQKATKKATAEVKTGLANTYTITRFVKGKKVKFVVNLDTIAKVINDSFKSNWFSEDESRAITELKKIPATPQKNTAKTKTFNLVERLSLVYAQKYKRNLKDDFIKYLSPKEFKSIEAYFRYV